MESVIIQRRWGARKSFRCQILLHLKLSNSDTATWQQRRRMVVVDRRHAPLKLVSHHYVGGKTTVARFHQPVGFLVYQAVPLFLLAVNRGFARLNCSLATIHKVYFAAIDSHPVLATCIVAFRDEWVPISTVHLVLDLLLVVEGIHCNFRRWRPIGCLYDVLGDVPVVATMTLNRLLDL